MKTIYTNNIKTFIWKVLLLGTIFFRLSANAQDPTQQDSIKTGYDSSEIQLKDPPSVSKVYEYDPILDRYVLKNKLGGDININYPLFLTRKEYEDLFIRETIQDYFKSKSQAVASDNPEDQRDLLPSYKIHSKLFESIFGSNTISVKPSGFVEVDLGARFTKQDNPSLSPRNRTNLGFDFDQRISVGLNGMIGTRVKVTANYDTQSTFGFQNLFKLEYTSEEDDILQKIEVGNVSFPLNTSLIRGAQSLFGVKAQLQFGKTTFTGIFSEQRSETKGVVVEGGGMLQDFEVFALEYDADRHYFLSQYFRNKYDQALKNYPLIDSRVNITRVEVWVTNRQNRINATQLDGFNNRNIVALQDLGEAQYTGMLDSELVVISTNGSFFNVPPNTPADNKNNKYDPRQIGSNFLNSNIREVATASSGFNIPGGIANEGTDYIKLENARKLTPNEFTYHPQLGYISLNQRLNNDEILGVAYQYTIGGDVYQVGEFGTDGVEATVVTDNPDPNMDGVPTTQALILKMLKSNITNINHPVWNLMMKNIYAIPGAIQLEQDGFRFNILYTDPSPLNYITPVEGTTLPADVTETPLLKVFHLDRLNYTNDPQPGGDGFFDFVANSSGNNPLSEQGQFGNMGNPNNQDQNNMGMGGFGNNPNNQQYSNNTFNGITIDPKYGRIIFTTVEPFGKHLFEKLRTSGMEIYDSELTYNPNQKKYVFTSLYKSTQAASLQESNKNKFLLKGRFRSSTGDGISIGAFNVPQGSVIVRAGGRVLLEGQDYTVNYQQGKVYIIDPSIQASGLPIEIKVENNQVFGQQTKRFYGLNIEHKFSEKFIVGGTFLRMSQKPFTQKSSYGQESVNNTIYGFNFNYSTEVPLFTRLTNKLPYIDTDVPSNFSLRGEVAFLRSDTPKGDKFDGDATVYIEDFEGSQTNLDMKSSHSWTLASPPINFGGEIPVTDKDSPSNLISGYRRAKLSWYTIDPIFYTSQRPNGITADDVSFNKTRRVYIRELYPATDIAQGQTTVIPTLDLTYYPTERGPYNYNPAANGTNTLPNPQDNWAGMMRGITSTNFEQTNVEYIQFWLLDPFVGNTGDALNPFNSGELRINLGEISEDILRDGRKMYENGLPEAGSTQATISTAWGKVPASQSLIYAFDTNEANRTAQDLGFDGLNDAEEAIQFPSFAGLEDPAQDNYVGFLQAQGNVLERYKRYNGVQGNSPVNLSGDNRGSSTLPDVEDVNRDNTMNTIDAYYEYTVTISPNMQEGQNYVTNVMDTTIELSGNGPNGETSTPARWIQFKIPITSGTAIGGISDLRSIRFMRMYLTGFSEEVTLRFGSLDLVRSEWRRYTKSLDPFEDDNTDLLDNTAFDVQTVNIQENGDRSPIRYVTPPGVVREQLYQNNTIINQNEQALSLRVSSADGTYNGGLEPLDSRAVFKQVNVDMRQYKRLKMFLHAESLPILSSENPNGETSPLQDDQMVAFIRFGNDFTENFYQIEVPLKITAESSIMPSDIWPEANNMDISLDLLTKLKVLSMGIDWTAIPPADNGIYYRFVSDPEIGGSATDQTRIGIKGNPNFGYVRTLMLGLKNVTVNDIRGEVWFNELRLAEMDNRGGMAATLSMDTNFADFANFSATGNMNTIGFGGIEDKPIERSREDRWQYNLVSSFELGKLMPKKWNFRLPFSYSIGEEFITPEYDPFYQDIRLKQFLDNVSDPAEKANIKERAEEYTKTRSINFIGVKKDRSESQKPHIYDPENITLSYSYTQTDHHSYEVENMLDQQVQTTADYSYSFNANPVEPFKASEKMSKSRYWKPLQEFNFNYLPSNITFNTSILRNYNRQQFRQVEVIGIGLDPMYRRNYMFNYNYGFNYNLTKSIKIGYNVTTSNIVRNYLDQDNIPIDSYGIWHDYWNAGEPNQHAQKITLNYDLPFDKFPFLSFLKSTYVYNSNFNWDRSPDGFRTIESEGIVYDLGNTVQNSSKHELNTTLNMGQFYQYIGLTKKRTRQRTPSRQNTTRVPGQRVSGGTQQAQANQPNAIVDFFIGLATSLKTVQLNYSQNQGTVLPGYLPSIGFFGTTNPTMGFVLGSQEDVRFEAAKNGWLTNYPEYNQNFTKISTKQINFSASLEPISDLKIDLTADRNHSENYSEQYDVIGNQYNPRSPYNYGNFSISTNMIRTAFSQSDENQSQAFQDFRNNRLIIANRLATQRGIDLSNSANIDADGFPIGYGKTNQEVLLPAFFSAYTGGNASNVSLGIFRDIPVPGWNVRYTGLMKIPFFKDKFRRFSLQHQYRSSYSINQYRSNFEYDQNPNGFDTGGNYLPKTIVSNVNMVEQFSPLVRVDFEMKNSVQIRAELKKERSLSLSFDNNLLTEMQGRTYTFGTGYRIKDVTFNTRLADNITNTIKSDLNLKLDLNFTNNKTIVRYLDYDNNELGGGQNMWSAKFTADYSFSRNFTVILYYDHSFSKAVISTAYPITNIRAGFTLRYSFGN